MYSYVASSMFGDESHGLTYNNLQRPCVSNDVQSSELNTPPPCLPVTQTFSHNTQSYYSVIKEYECAIKHNAELWLELRKAKEDAECADKAARDLAAWMHDERQGLLQRIAELQATNDQLRIAVKEQKPKGRREKRSRKYVPVKPRHPYKFSEDALFSVDDYLGMEEEIVVPGDNRIEVEMTKTWGLNVVDEEEDSYTPPDARESSSIMDQVDELIAEEKRRLPITEYFGHSMHFGQ
ncbi:hypothetical protein P153DRAFT_393126 [Dothidotthia symphoricarpi CBS 119687]|uniref:Uncharacterized protein n=1 Tax=Dothidotthia symphoricarpi CBS 119687 TaxID=1392245 RepID=A0A6A6AR16_9PLEO|nr:uncharacterized protein P153DRAFT_393126 [Dothidotthia symphoricarpi CBS 119687]KAF2133287.1 hypothetical protein P153DRAFT_393126 [Dothidotthia symphoricarpi CBS 119687]